MATALEDYQALKRRFPRQGTENVNCDNCDWTDRMVNSVNCYWCFDGSDIQESMYSFSEWKVVGCVDTLWNALCERCYEVSDSIESTDCSFCQYIAQCYNMQYCFDCGSSHDCFGCCDLSNKEFCIFNIQYTEEEYHAKVAELKKKSPEEILNQVAELRLKFPVRHSNFSDNTNSEYVDYVYKSKDAYYCFDCNLLEDCGYVSNSNECKDSWDCGPETLKSEHCAESVDSSECYNCYEAQDCHRCYDSSYVYKCVDSNNLFMCSNLSNAKYCILNVQYSPEEYKTKVAEIKNQLGLKFTASV